MASRSEHPDQALAELERIAGLLETELAGWRRRCLKAEAEVEAAKGRVPDVTTGDRRCFGTGSLKSSPRIAGFAIGSRRRASSSSN